MVFGSAARMNLRSPESGLTHEPENRLTGYLRADQATRQTTEIGLSQVLVANRLERRRLGATPMGRPQANFDGRRAYHGPQGPAGLPERRLASRVDHPG